MLRPRRNLSPSYRAHTSSCTTWASVGHPFATDTSRMRRRRSMLGKKIQLDEASTQLLKTLKLRTGLTHQYLCRIALCVSLEEAGEVDPGAYDEQGLEFNRYTLTGEWDVLFVAFLKEWITANDPER